MAVAISSLRATLDATDYVSSANAVADANAKMAASQTAAGTAIDATERKLGTAGDGFTRLQRSIDPAFASQQKLTQGTATLQAALDKGSISTTEHARLLDLLTQRYAPAIQAGAAATGMITSMATAARGTGQDLEGLAASHDHVTNSAARTREGMVLVHEFLSGNYKRAVGSATIELQNFGLMHSIVMAAFNPFVLAAVAAVGVFATLEFHYQTNQTQLKGLSAALSAAGTSSLASAANLQQVSVQLHDIGVAAGDANAAVLEIARNNLVNPALAGQIASLSKDIAAATGDTFPAAVKRLTDAVADGYSGFVKLDDQLHIFTASELSSMKTMAEHGDRAGVLNTALASIDRTLGGSHEAAMSNAAKGAANLSAAWTDLLNGLTDTKGFKAAHEGLATLLTDLNNLISKGQAPQSAFTGALLNTLIPGYAGRLANGELGNALTIGNPVANQAEFANALAARNGQTAFGGAGLAGSNLTVSGSPFLPGAAAQLGYVSGLTQGYEPGQITWSNQLPQTQLNQTNPYATPQWSSANLGAGPGVNYDPALAASLAANGITTGSAVSSSTGNIPGTGVQTPAEIERQTKAVDASTVANQRALDVDKLRAQAQIELRTRYEATAEGIAKNYTGTQLEEFVTGKVTTAVAQYNIQLNKEAQINDLRIKGLTDTAAAYQVSEVAGLRAAAMSQAQIEHTEKGVDVTTRYNQILRDQAATAIDAGARALVPLQQQTSATQRLADAASKGAAAEHEAQVQNTVTAATHDALAKAIASGNPALIAQAQALQTATEAQVRANDAAQTALQLRTQVTANDNQIQVYQLEAQLAGQTTEQINSQVSLLQAKQLLQSKGAALSQEERDNYLASTVALGQANIALSESVQNAQRVNSTMSSIGSTIDSSITQNLQNAFDGKQVTKWGDVAKQIFSQIQAQLISLTIIKPAIGSVLSLLGFGGAASSFGSLFSGAGALSGNSLLGGLFASNDNKAQTLTDSSGKVIGTLSSGSNSSGGLFSGVGSFINNNIGSKLGFSAGNSLSQSDLLGLGLPAEQAAGGFSDVGGLFGATTLTSVLPFAGAALGLIPLLGGLFGNSKPSNFSSGALVDLASGKSSFSSSGNAQNDQTVNSITSGVSQFIQQVQQLTGGAIGGVINPDAGSRDGIKVHYILGNGSGTITAGSADDAVAQIEQLLIKNIAGVTGTLKTLIDQISDPAQLQSIVSLASAYDNVAHAADPVIASLDQTTDAFAPYTAALATLNTQYATLTAQAQQYGLALDPITQAQTAAKSAIQGKFSDAVSQAYNSASGNDFLNSISTIEKNASSAIGDAQSLGAGQDTINQIYATRAALLKSTLQGLSDDQLPLAIQQFGSLDDTVAGVVSSIRAANQALTDQAAAQQAAAVSAQAAAQAQAEALAKTTAITAWLNGEALGSNSSLSPAAQLSEAQRQFSAASGGTDANALTSAADALLNAAKAFYASSPGYAAIESMTRSQVARFGNLPGFATGGSFTVGGFGGTDSQLVAFRASPAERVTIGTPANANDTAVNNALLAALLEEVQGLRASNEQMSRDFAMFRQQLKTLKPAA